MGAERGDSDFAEHKERFQNLPAELGSVNDLRTALGLHGSSSSYDTTLVAVDTETEYHRLLPRLVEVGITTLNTRHVRGLDPGKYVQKWMSKAEHHHVVIDTASSPNRRMNSNMFGESLLLATHETGAAIKRLWISLGPNIAIIGHSVLFDVTALDSSPELRVNLQELSGISGKIERVYDTHHLARVAEEQGLKFPSFRLGKVVRKLQPDPEYVFGETVRGCHNAGNDAAYSMMAALLFAVRFDAAKAQYVQDPDESD